MKHLVTLLVALALFSTSAWAQCTTTIPSSSDPGLYPPDSTLPCIQRTVAYSEVIEFKNFEDVDGTPFGFPVTLQVDSIRIDSIFRIPTGLTAQFNNADRVYAGGEIGCILLSGTTADAAGTVNLGFEATVWASAFGSPLPSQSVNESTLANLGLEYNLEIIEPGAACRGVAPGAFNLNITGVAPACAGDTLTLTATTDATSPNYLWSTGETTASIEVVVPSAVSVTVTDANSVALADTVSILADVAPIAGFFVNVIQDSVIVTDTSLGNVDFYIWDFAGEGNATTSQASYVFSEDGTYTITLVVGNDCGNDTISQDVTVTTIGIHNLGDVFSSFQVSPNPSNGNFTLQLVANEASPVNVKVFNLQGQAVYSSVFNTLAGQANTQSINLNNAATGIYILQLQANDALVTQKLIVK